MKSLTLYETVEAPDPQTGRKKKAEPELLLRGSWLERFGFAPGERVRITVPETLAGDRSHLGPAKAQRRLFAW